MAAGNLITDLETFDTATGDVRVIVETPRGHRNKVKYEPSAGLFRFDKSLPAGMAFPLDFGFFPSTMGEDGDPLDALLLMDEPASTGLLVRTRLIGVIEAEQTSHDKTIRNDRLVTVAVRSLDWKRIQTLDDLGGDYLTQMEHFFISYNEMEDRQFKPIRRAGPEQARKLLEESRQQFQARPPGSASR